MCIFENLSKIIGQEEGKLFRMAGGETTDEMRRGREEGTEAKKR